MVDRSALAGQKAERAAASFLASRGLEILARNYRSRWGEIDIIAVDNGDIVFVEVKYRRSSSFGGALASITNSKKRKIALTPLDFLIHHPHCEHNIRFDIIAIERKLTWIKAALSFDEANI